MPIKLFDTLSAKMTDFVPLKENEVKMYVCGVTVYDECHLGHARAAICFDVIRKYFEFRGYKVTMVVNFTDVDDKIINRAKLEKVDALEISRRYIDKYFVDMDALKIARATVYPKATEHISHIIAFIEKLIERGFAYVIDGEVYFEVSKFKDYGKLSKRNFEDMLAGARIAVDERLRNPHDFCLWKAAKPGEISWKSPWAEGRPGWHIECSAMSGHYLGDTFDIHGGGLDLTFPHHENEIAQSEALTGKPFARYWMHNGLVNINSEKMSKSLGNYFTISSLLEKFSPFVIRYFILSNHYRSPINFTVEKMQEVEKALGSITRFMKRMKQIAAGAAAVSTAGRDGVSAGILADADAFEAKFNEFMENDFNTAGAIGSMFQYISAFNQVFAADFPEKARSAAYVYGVFMRYINLLAIADEEFIASDGAKAGAGAGADGLAEELIKVLIKVRSTLKSEKNYKMADFVRDEIKALGVVLEDTKEGTKFHIEKK